MAMLICYCKCRHLNTRLKFSTGFATVDNEDQRTFHSNKTEFVFCILPADVYLCEEWFWNGDCVTDDDTFARTEVVESHHETISFGVAHDEGEGDGILGVNTANDDTKDDFLRIDAIAEVGEVDRTEIDAGTTRRTVLSSSIRTQLFTCV